MTISSRNERHTISSEAPCFVEKSRQGVVYLGREALSKRALLADTSILQHASKRLQYPLNRPQQPSAGSLRGLCDGGSEKSCTEPLYRDQRGDRFRKSHAPPKYKKANLKRSAFSWCCIWWAYLPSN